MSWKPWLLLAALLLAWTAQWLLGEQNQRHQSARALAALLGSEVQVGLESKPFQPGPALNRLPLWPHLRAARLLGADHAQLWSFGQGEAFEESQPVTEAGQHLATLQLNYEPPSPPAALTVGWLAALALALWGKTSGNSVRSLVLELDEHRRIRRLSGNTGLLAGAGELVGHSLDEVMNGPQASGRTLSELSRSAARSLVVVRDSQDIRKVQRRLKQLERHYRQLCDGAHDFIVILEPEGNLVFLNRSLQLQLGAPVRFEQLFNDTSFERVRARLHDTLLEGKSGDFEAELALPNGTTIPVSGTLSVVTVEDSSPLTVLGIFRDLSAQRAAEARLLQAQKMEAVGLLAGGVAHDFNNFLCIFSGLSGLLRAESRQPELDEYLDELDQAVLSAGDLTRQLLHFTRKKAATQQSFPLDATVAEFARMASRLLGQTVPLETSLQSQANLLGDRTQLEQVILNLLINARDAMPAGGPVRLTTGRREGMAEVQVSDRGSGMSPEVAARIFEPYFTTKEPGKGTGLGLSTVYAIVTGWGGEISVSSQPGQGTTFTVLLPLA